MYSGSLILWRFIFQFDQFLSIIALRYFSHISERVFDSFKVVCNCSFIAYLLCLFDSIFGRPESDRSIMLFDLFVRVHPVQYEYTTFGKKNFK